MRFMALIASAAFAMSACAPEAVSPSQSPTSGASNAGPGAIGAAANGLADRPVAVVTGPARRWFTVPDGLFADQPQIFAAFTPEDVSAGLPRARLRSTGQTVDMTPVPTRGGGPGSTTPPTVTWLGMVPLDRATPGSQAIDVVVRMRDGTDAVVGTREFMLSAAEYVVWTLDFEGDDAGDAGMANTGAIADGLGVPMTVMWNPRVWTTAQVSPARADAMLAWTKGRGAKGDEIALHLHLWTDYVRAAGVVPRTTPNWGGRGDGYDVPITAYTESETRTLVEYGLRLMADRGLPKPTSFRAGALFANDATLRAIAALGFTADCSSAPAGPFGALQLPWTLPSDAQPYYPARDDANRAGDLPLLEAPTIGGNTYGHSAISIAGVVQADLRMLAPPGQPAAQRRALTVVSHPSTIDATERGAIETLFRAFEPLRYDRDAGPLRFVTLAQLAKAYAR